MPFISSLSISFHLHLLLLDLFRLVFLPLSFNQLFLKMSLSMPLHLLFLQLKRISFCLWSIWKNPTCPSKSSPNVTSPTKPSLKSLFIVIFRTVQPLYFVWTSNTTIKRLLSNYLCICPSPLWTQKEDWALSSSRFWSPAPNIVRYVVHIQ